MRALVRQLLLAHEPFAKIYPEGKLIESSAVTLNVQREPPFAVIRMGTVLRGVDPAFTRTMSLWCHDAPGDYGQIDEALRHARTALDVWGITTSTGSLMRSQWMGEGEDGYDDGFHTIVRVGRWELTGTGE